jgi:hypothetical protein
MGLSSVKGNSGFLGIDKRGTYSGNTVGNVSTQKHYLERRLGHFPPPTPPEPSNVLFEDDFSSAGFNNPQVGNAWTVVNGSETTAWIVGTDVRDDNNNGNEGGASITIPSGSTYAAFPSNNATNNYYDASQYCHIYFEFDIPDGITSLTLEFDWACYGERSTTPTAYTNYDMGYLLFFNPATFTPAAGSLYAANGTGWERIIGSDTAPNDDGGRFTGDSGADSRSNGASRTGFVYEKITIDGTEISTGPWCTNCTRGISFSWMADSSLQDNPSFTIANVKLSYNE